MKLVNISGSNPNDLNLTVIENVINKNNVDKNSTIIQIINPYDRVYINWFNLSLFMKYSFIDFVRTHLFFDLENLIHFQPSSKFINEHSNYHLIRQEDLVSTHELYSKYATNNYPLFGNRYDATSIGIINYIYNDDFNIGNYNKIETPTGLPLNLIVLRTNSKQDESFNKNIEKLIDEKNWAGSINLINQYPDCFKYFDKLILCYKNTNQFDKIVDLTDKILSVNRNFKNDQLIELVGIINYRKNKHSQAIYYFELMNNPNNDIKDLIKLIKWLQPIYEFNREQYISDVCQYNKTRKHILEYIDITINQIDNCNYKVPSPSNCLILPNMIHSYYNQSNKELFSKICKLYRKLFPFLSYTANHCINYKYNKSESNNKIKIGFISNNFKNHSVTHSSSGVILNLDTNKYEVFLITFKESIKRDFMWLVLNNSSLNMIVLDGNDLEKHRDKISSLTLDVLVYCDIGMNTNTYLLSFLRLAPVQVNTWGHSDTSGVDTIDYFISSKLFESHDANMNYSEKLILHESLSTYYYNRINVHQFNLTKQLYDYLLPTGQYIALISASVMKFHPTYDIIINKILSLCSNMIMVVLVSGSKLIGDESHVKLYKRWNQSIDKSNLDRIHFMHHVDYENFINLVNLSNIVLDTYPFGSCNTALDSFSVDKIIVGCQSNLINGRFVYGFYNKMGITDLMIDNIPSYIDMVCKCYNDQKYSYYLENEIRKNKHKLYNDKQSVSEWDTSIVDFLENINSKI